MPKKNEGAFSCKKNEAGNMKYFVVKTNVESLNVMTMPELVKELTDLGIDIKTPPNVTDEFQEHIQLSLKGVKRVDDMAIKTLEFLEESVDVMRIVNITDTFVFSMLKKMGFKVSMLKK